MTIGSGDRHGQLHNFAHAMTVIATCILEQDRDTGPIASNQGLSVEKDVLFRQVLFRRVWVWENKKREVVN